MDDLAPAQHESHQNKSDPELPVLRGQRGQPVLQELEADGPDDTAIEIAGAADVMLVLIIGGTGYLYGGLIGAVIFKLMQEFFSTITPQFWQFWIGAVLVVIVLIGRERLHRWAMFLPRLVAQKFARGQGR
jgi:hypothetical protein